MSSFNNTGGFFNFIHFQNNLPPFSASENQIIRSNLTISLFSAKHIKLIREKSSTKTHLCVVSLIKPKFIITITKIILDSIFLKIYL
jgi:hypothetical protein